MDDLAVQDVGEPLMPSFFSGAPNETPSSDFSSTKAEMPLDRAEASVTAMTV